MNKLKIIRKITMLAVGFLFLLTGRLYGRSIPAPNIVVKKDTFGQKPFGTKLFGTLTEFNKELKKTLIGYRNNPKFRAFLDVIAYAEGTYKYGLLGYKLRYPYEKNKKAKFDSFAWHPGKWEFITTRGEPKRSSAAGYYMIKEIFWDIIAKNIGLHDFSPLNQDLAALYLINEKKGAIRAIKNLEIEKAITAVNPVWSPLPGSPYGQVTTTMPELMRFFKKRYEHYKKVL